jgi:hypothetical protein
LTPKKEIHYLANANLKTSPPLIVMSIAVLITYYN